jgi:hypothetical protein
MARGVFNLRQLTERGLVVMSAQHPLHHGDRAHWASRGVRAVIVCGGGACTVRQESLPKELAGSYQSEIYMC